MGWNHWAGGKKRLPGRAVLALVVIVALLLPAAGGAKKKEEQLQLPEKYRQWLESVEKLITKTERELFLQLEKDYQRDAFIEEFWKARDPYPRTSRNEFRDEFMRRTDQATELFGDLRDERAQTLLINGHPTARIEVSCSELWPIEVWFYDSRDYHGGDVLLLFYQRWGQGPWRLWHPLDGLDDLAINGRTTYGDIDLRCTESDAILAAIGYLTNLGVAGVATLQAQLSRPIEQPRGEWVASFQAYSTDLPEGAELFDATLMVGYPGRYQSRTIVQGTVAVPVAGVASATLGDFRSYNLILTGEVLSGDVLFDSFRIKYDFPADEVEDREHDLAGNGSHGPMLPLVFERYLRGGTYRLIVKVEDLGSGRVFREERTIEVPKLDQAPAPPPLDPETARILAEANAAIRNGETTVKIAPLQGEWQTGLVRIDAMTTGDDIDRVSFVLDDETVLTKRRPPWNVELDLGEVPRPRLLRVVAFNAAGEEVASDEVMLNAGRHRFAVRLVEPQRGKRYARSLRAKVDVSVPEGEGVERVELYVNETKVATLYQPPYVQPIVLPEDEPVAYVRAVAYTPDGNSTDDWVFVNAPGNLDELDIQYVELYVTVLGGDKRPVDDLRPEDFQIFEDGAPQTIARFERVRDLPIHAAIMLDVSASMEERLADAQAAALRFFEQTVTPRDRATVVTFNDHPNLTARFTNDVTALAAGLAGLKAERSTAIWDSLIFTLYYFNGIKGQRTILLLSDGRDESSRFPYEDALEYARRAGVTIYAIGLDLPRSALSDRRKLNKLADETGGRAFFIKDVAELGSIYETIERELRSRYLITYQSTNTSTAKDFRFIEVKMTRGGLEAKTMRGYYP
ncbi:MAG: VWA domain-containing protein [Acidobacteria bacterium]|nr:MAG: VWA domain-containing protein [Acidobacteriota bacterium]